VSATGQPGTTPSTPGPRRRADAERSINAILDAALACLSDRPDTTMVDIARAAGVGRVTLYTHFPSRETLVEAVVDRAIAESTAALDAAVPDDEPADRALRTLIHSSWQDVDQEDRLFEAAQRTLGPERLREHHAPFLTWMEKLIGRGRTEGVFRDDLPAAWLVTTVYSLFHAAAEDIPAGRLRPSDAAHVLEATILAALAPSDGTPRPPRAPRPARR
jgi:AcrR family transcriptional regulator